MCYGTVVCEVRIILTINKYCANLAAIVGEIPAEISNNMTQFSYTYFDFVFLASFFCLAQTAPSFPVL